jgi:hypothetical protein
MLRLSIMEDGFEHIHFRKSIGKEETQRLKTKILCFENRQKDATCEIKGLTEIKFDSDQIQTWLAVARSVLDEMGFTKARLPGLGQIELYKTDNPNFKGTTVGAVDGYRRRIVFLLGDGISIEGKDKDDIRCVFQHELGHWPQEAVATKSQNEHLPVELMAVGFDRNIVTESVNNQIIATRRGILNEPLAELFSYFCSVEMSIPVHRVGNYPREVSFLLSLLDKMSSINDSSIKKEFGILFKASATRDFSWYKHLYTTFNKHFLSLELDAQEAKNKTLDFIRGLNTIISIEGVD